MDKYEVQHAVNFALNAKPLDFDKSIKSILGDKVVAAIDNKKAEIGQAIFSTTEVESDVDDQELPTED